MTWRVVILAFTIMLAGATAPVIRDAVGGRAGYRVMGLVMAAIIVVGAVGAYVGTRSAPIGRVEPGAGSLRDQLRIVAAARDFRLLLATYVVQALATGCMLAGVDYLAEDVLDQSGATTILFVCFVGPALVLTPAWAALGARIGKRTGYVLASGVLSLGGARLGDGAVGARGRGVRRGRGRRLRLRGLPGLPPRDAAGRGGRGRAPDGLEPGRRLHRGVDRGRDPRPRARARPVRARARDRGLRVVDRPATWSSRTRRSPRSRYGFSVLPAVLVLLSLWSLSRYRLDAREVALAEGGH